MGNEVDKVELQEDQAQGITGALHPAANSKDRFCRNFIWVGILGVLILFGIGRYTDYLETVIGLLGLGGIFAWVAFLFNVISESRKNTMQRAFENFLNHPWTSIVLFIVTMGVLLLAANMTCIIVDSGRDTIDRHVEIRRADSNEPVYAVNITPDFDWDNTNLDIIYIHWVSF